MDDARSQGRCTGWHQPWALTNPPKMKQSRAPHRAADTKSSGPPCQLDLLCCQPFPPDLLATAPPEGITPALDRRCLQGRGPSGPPTFGPAGKHAPTTMSNPTYEPWTAPHGWRQGPTRATASLSGVRRGPLAETNDPRKLSRLVWLASARLNCIRMPRPPWRTSFAVYDAEPTHGGGTAPRWRPAHVR